MSEDDKFGDGYDAIFGKKAGGVKKAARKPAAKAAKKPAARRPAAKKR
jgi:hypothetical protein